MPKPTETGVYFRRADYPGFWIRLVIALVDGLVICAVCWGLWMLIDALPLDHEVRSKVLAMSLFAFLYFYSVEMKRRWGSVGNMATRTRVVAITGGMPSIWSMVVRTSMWVMGPLVVLIDLLWILSDRSRQMIRDRVSAVYVVRSSAHPQGTGRIVCSSWMFLGYSMLIKEVKTKNGEPGATDNPDNAQRLREDH